eukprot:scaffold2499_cov125-Cylindrotheca_fusiformis.AAC.3
MKNQGTLISSSCKRASQRASTWQSPPRDTPDERRRSNSASTHNAPSQSPLSPRIPAPGRKKARTPPIFPSTGVNRPVRQRNNPRSSPPGGRRPQQNSLKSLDGLQPIMSPPRPEQSKRRSNEALNRNSISHYRMSSASRQRRSTQNGLTGKSNSSRRRKFKAHPSTNERRDEQNDDGGRVGRGRVVSSANISQPVNVDFKVGQLVRLENLNAKEMNGREGYVYAVYWDRVHVATRDHFGIDYVAIQPKNLMILAQPQEKSTTKVDGPDWDRVQHHVIHNTQEITEEEKAVTTYEAMQAIASNNAGAYSDGDSVTEREVQIENGAFFETEDERQETQEKLLHELKEKGLSLELLCDSADDAVSAVTFSDQSYVLDLYRQKENREQTRKEQIMDEAYDIYTMNLKKEGTEGRESLFLEVYKKLSSEKGRVFEEQDVIADRRLAEELRKLLDKQAREEETRESLSPDFVYNEEEMYPEIGRYEPVVRLPSPKPKHQGITGEKIPEKPIAADLSTTTEPDSQTPIEVVDDSYKCACSVM